MSLLRKHLELVSVLIAAIPMIVVLRNSWMQMSTWPMTDAITHAAKLHFFQTVGWGGLTQQWNYGVGYVLFATYPPGFFLIAFPIMQFLQFVNVSPAILPAMMISAFLLVAGIAFLIHRLVLKNFFHSIILVSLVFFNPLSINWIFETGRFPELTGWFFFIPILGIILNHFNKPLSWRGLLRCGVLFSLVIISHPAVFTMALLAWGIFSVLTFSINKFKTTISILLGIVLSSAWLVSYFSAKKELLLSTYVGYHLEASYIFTNFFHGVSVIILLFLAFRSRDQSHPLSGWWTGHAVLGVITLLGIPAIIPFFNQPHQVTYATYFFLIGIHGILRAHTMFTRGIIHRAVPLFVLLFLLTSVYSAVKFADFAEKRDIHTMYGSEIDTLPSFIKSPLTCYPECGGELSYWVINHNISTTDNLSPEATPISIARNREELSRGIETGDCTTIYSSLQKLQTKTLLVYPVFCPALQACGFSTQKTSRWCITTTP